MAVKATKAHVIITADTKTAVNAIEQMKKTLADMEKKIKSIPEGSKQWTNMQKRMGNVKSAIEQSEREFASLDSVLKNLSGSSFRQLSKAYNQITQQIKSHSRATEADRAELSKLISDQKRLEKEMAKVSGMWKTQEGAINSVIKRLSAYVAVYGGFNMVVGKISELTKKNLQFADTISDIQKVSGLSQREVEGLTREIAKIDSRNSQQELDRLAYAAGKLGIGTREGAEGILQFTKAADKLQVALKEYLGEDGVVSLMKVADVMGDTKTYGVEQALLKTGSAVNYMTQSTAAAADYMVDFLARTGGMGKAANITTPELVGLASTLDSLSQNVEVSATALNKFFAQLMTHQTAIAQATGLSKEWIQTQLQQGKTMEVVMTIFDKLGEKGGLSALGPLFKDLGSDGARLMQVMTQLANNSDRVRAYVAMSNQAFKEGTSVTKEYAIKNENAAAIMERMANSWDKMFVNAKNTGVLKEVAQDLYDVSKYLQTNTFWTNSLSLAFKTLILALKTIITLLPVIINGFAALKISQLVTGFLRLVPAITASARAMTLLQAASGWIGAVVAGITLLVYGITSLADASAKTKVKVDELGESLRKSARSANAEIVKTKKEVDKLFASLNKENLTQAERKNIIAQINTQYKDYLPKLLSEKSSADEIAKAWDDVNKKLKANIQLKAKQTDLEKITEKYSRRQGDALEGLSNTLDKRIGNDKGKGNGNRSVDVQERVKNEVDSQVADAIQKGGNSKTITNKVMGTLKDNIKGNVSDKDYSRISSGKLSQDAYIKEQQNQAIAKAKEEAQKDKRHMTPAERTRIQQEAASMAKRDWDAIRDVRKQVYDYATAQIMQYNDEKRTNEYWDRLIPKDAVETPTTPENPTVITEDTSKEDAKKARAAAAESRKELREMRKEAQEELKGIKSIISAFYEQREAEIQADFEAGLITEIQRTELLSETAMQKAQSMIDAWNVMLKKPGATDIWAERLKAMQGQIYGGSAEMEATLEDIASRNLVKTGQLLDNFGTSMQDGLKKTVAQNENILATHLSGVKTRIHSALKEYDLVFKAYDKAQKNLETQGMVSLSPEKMQEIDMKNEQAKINPAVQATSVDAEMKNMLAQINSNYQQLFTIDIKKDEGIKTFTDMLSTINGLSKSAFTQGADETQDAFKERMQLFYKMLLEMGEGVEQAQTQARKEFTTSAKLAYSASGKESADKTNIEQAQTGVNNNAQLGAVGLDSKIAADEMEIKLYEAKLEAAANYYDFLKERGADNVTLREQEMAVEQAAMDLADKMIQQTADRLSSLKDIGSAVETFGEEFGEALDGSLADRQDAAKNLLKSLGNVTKKMIVEWVKQRIQQSINHKLMQKQEKAHQAFEISTATETGQKKQVLKQVEGTALTSIQSTTDTTLETEQKAHDAKDVAQEGTTTVAKTSLNLAQAIAKCFSSLGPIGGAVAAATVSAAIGAVLAWAMSKIGGSADTPGSTTSTTKLASGMLTYDAGNVQKFRTLDEGTVASVMGTDGHSYTATVQSNIGTGIVSSPVATLIDGQPSLVGERGAEMVIGRQTFAAMQTLRPDLIQQIVRFDRNRSGAQFRTYDEGNVGEFGMGEDGASAIGGNSAEMMALISSNRDTSAALFGAITALNAQLAAGIGVRKYGAGGVVEEVADGFNFLKGKSANKNINRLFGN